MNRHQMSSSAIPCALRQHSESDNERLIGTCSLNRRSPKMWTYTATLLSYNIVVSCACAATHKNFKKNVYLQYYFKNIISYKTYLNEQYIYKNFEVKNIYKNNESG